MENGGMNIVYRGGFNGFLSAVCYALQSGKEVVGIYKNRSDQKSLFDEMVEIEEDEVSARDLWLRLQKRNYESTKTVYFAFLSESQGIETLLYRYIQHFLYSGNDSIKAISPEALNKIRLLAGLVRREKKRMEMSISLEQVYPDLQISYIAPEFNVLPLITKFFKAGHNLSSWIIYDRKRNYGVHYDGHITQLISAGVFRHWLNLKHLEKTTLAMGDGLPLDSDQARKLQSAGLAEKVYASSVPAA